MKPLPPICLTVLLAIGLTPVGQLQAQQPSPAPATTPSPQAPSAPQPGIEPDAAAILKAMSAKLATAKTISFTAVATYESPAVNGQPLYYTTTSQVTVQRPDKIRVIRETCDVAQNPARRLSAVSLGCHDPARAPGCAWNKYFYAQTDVRLLTNDNDASRRSIMRL
jgi:hypothetical protein